MRQPFSVLNVSVCHAPTHQALRAMSGGGVILCVFQPGALLTTVVPR